MPLLMLPSALWYRRGVPFLGAYLAVWLALALVALRVPWMTFGAYAALAGGLYELTPVKRRFLERCRTVHGLRHGFDCAGSSAVSFWWTATVAALVFAEKVAPFGLSLVVPAGVALVAAGLIGIA
jgi:predicted metal-binding membrane protein